MQIRHFLRAPAAPALDRGAGAEAVPGRARPGRTGRQAGLRQRLGGRAPLPGGIFALLRAGGLPGRLLATHQADPARPRHRADAAGLQPPRPRRRAHRHARPGLQRPGGVGHRRKLGPAGAGRLRRAGGGEAQRLARGGRAVRQHDGHGPLSGLRGPVLLHADAATSCPSRCRSRTRRCGSPAPTARPSSWPRGWASAR